ncbi:MAG: TetR/AcrR family transcriptional regulator [Myxococcales bacterium]|nr:TetR/AcrR family transcriptional regulator [Myxococcales bacterium]
MRADGREPTSAGVGDAFLRFFRRPPKQTRSRALVEAMLAALEEQLATPDRAESWTLETLVDRAGVGVGSFYEYFSNKESLLGALVGAVTDKNFRELLAASELEADDTLETAVARVTSAIARTYLGRPTLTRVVMASIGRLGLMSPVVVARDRFARELAKRAQRFFPDASEDALAETMRMVADATMGIVSGELERTAEPDVAMWSSRIAEMGCLLLRSRHEGAATQ